MALTNVPITAGSGTPIGVDQISGVDYQVVEPATVVAGAMTPVSTTNPMPVGGVDSTGTGHALTTDQSGQLLLALTDVRDLLGVLISRQPLVNALGQVSIGGSLPGFASAADVIVANASFFGRAMDQADLSSSARTASGVGNAQGGGSTSWPTKLMYSVAVTAVSGTSPTLDVKLQASNDAGTNWTDMPGAVFATITGTGSWILAVAPGITPVANQRVADIVPPLFRVSYTIGGTSPSFTFSTHATATY